MPSNARDICLGWVVELVLVFVLCVHTKSHSLGLCLPLRVQFLSRVSSERESAAVIIMSVGGAVLELLEKQASTLA